MIFRSGDSIEAGEAVPLVASGELWLLDVREAYEWASGHTSAAHLIPMRELGVRQGELPEDGTIAVICHSGHRSRMVTDALVAADYAAVDVAGGMLAWQAAGGEIVTGSGTADVG